MKSYFKFLSRNKLYTFIELFGLSVSLAFIILVFHYVHNEWNVDDFHPNKEDIFVLASGKDLTNSYGLSSYLSNRYPEIERLSAFASGFGDQVQNHEGITLNASINAADSSFFSIFSFPLVEGERGTLLSHTNSAVISERFAKEMGYEGSPIGEKIQLRGEWFTLTGVMKDIAHSSIPYCDLLVRADRISLWNPSINSESLNNAGGVVFFIQQKRGSDLLSRRGDLLNYFKEFYWIYQREIRKEVNLYPLQEIYMQKTESNEMLQSGKPDLVRILLGASLVLFLFSFINYINLTVAQTGFRAREMATRRLLGEQKSGILFRYFREALLLTFLTFLIGFILAVLFEGKTGELLGSRIDLIEGLSWRSISFYLLLILLTSFLSSFIPSLIVLRYKAVDVMKGLFSAQTKMYTARIFIVIQITLSIVVLSLLWVVYLQLNHLIELPMGYKTNDVLYIQSFVKSEKKELYRQQIGSLPCVESVGFTNGTPVTFANNSTTIYHDKNISIMQLVGDSCTFRMLGFEVVKRFSDPLPGYVWITEKTAADLELAPDETECPALGLKICGIVKNYHRNSALEDMSKHSEVFIIQLPQKDGWEILIKTKGDHAEARKQIEDKIKELTGETLVESVYMSDIQHSFYQEIEKTMLILLILGFLAVVVSILGLLAMSVYFTRQRKLEVTIRKVFGSTSESVFFRIITPFMQLFLLSFVLALPIGWFIATHWLESYSERITLTLFPLFLAGLFMLLIALIAISWQGCKAAFSNPVGNLKNA